MSDVFQKRQRDQKPGLNMQVTLGRKETKGDIGLEIEVEGNKFPKPEGYVGSYAPVKMPSSKFWSYVHDGSLRGVDNAEYILTKPINFSEVPKAITEIYATLADYGSVVDDSHRTSVHVHLNCQPFYLNRLTSFMALWYTFEEILTAWCGEHRVGNLFCLRAKDAPAIINQLRQFIRRDGQMQLSEHLHYAGLNAHALLKFGSIEVRTLRGCADPQVILDWVSILQRLYELSAEFEDPRDICGMFSSEGPLSFFERVFQDRATLVRSVVTLDDDGLRDSMYDGIRMAQDLCFCRDWGEYRKLELKPDPFSRSLKSVAKKLQSQPSVPSPVSINTIEAYDPFANSEPEPEYDDMPDEEMSPMQWAQQVLSQGVPNG